MSTYPADAMVEKQSPAQTSEELDNKPIIWYNETLRSFCFVHKGFLSKIKQYGYFKFAPDQRGIRDSAGRKGRRFMKHRLIRLFSMVILLTTILSIIPTAAAADDERMQAHKAYYAYLTEEIAGVGEPVRDEDYYNMFTDHVQRPAILEEILAVYLVDVTNDGIEELIIKRQVTHESSYVLDVSLMDWICIYSFVDGSLTRIGQNRRWRKSVEEDTWTDYEPDGYIGDVLSSAQVPTYSDEYVTLFWSEDGQVFLCDKEMVTRTEGYFSLYSFNGTHMDKEIHFACSWIPDWSYGPIQSESGSLLHKINGETVTAGDYQKKLNEYTLGGTYKLLNNDYHDVLQILSQTIEGKDVPYGDANPHFHIRSEWMVENNQHYRTCQSGCDVKLDVGDCSGGEATCFQKAICDVCQQPYGEFAEHDPSRRYSSENGQHFIACRTKGCTQTFEVGDCVDSDKDHTCDVCDAEVGTHEAPEGTHTCSYCNKRATRCTDSDLDHICDVCGETVYAHTEAYGKHTCAHCNKPVSECVDSNKDRTCDICGEDYKDTTSMGCSGVVGSMSIIKIILLGFGAGMLTKKKR